MSNNVQTQKTNGIAIAGFILAFIIPILGLIFSIVGLSNAKRNQEKGDGIALAGIILSSIFMFLQFILLILVLTTFNGVQTNGRDLERQVDIKALHGQLEAYYAQNGYYPSLDQLNNPEFIEENLQELDLEALKDPNGESSKLKDEVVPASYAYVTSPIVCDNVKASCRSYILTATLEEKIEGSFKYTKASLN